jgi:hypothetical protein
VFQAQTLPAAVRQGARCDYVFALLRSSNASRCLTAPRRRWRFLRGGFLAAGEVALWQAQKKQRREAETAAGSSGVGLAGPREEGAEGAEC